MLAVGKPSSRPRWSPFDDLALEHVGDAEAAARGLHVAGRDLGPDPRGGDRSRRRPRPASGPGSRTRGARPASRGVPRALAPKWKFSPTATAARAELLDQRVVDEVLGAAVRELLVEVDHDQLLDPEAVEHVALHLERVDQLRRLLGLQHFERVRLEGEHGVDALDHRAVAEVDAVEGADRDVAGARRHLLERGDLDRHQRTFSPKRVADGRAPAPRPRRSGPRDPPPRSGTGRPRRGADRSSRRRRASRPASARRSRRCTRSRSGAIAVSRPESSSARCTSTSRTRRLDRLAAVGLLVEALAADPHRRGHRHPLAHGAGRQLQRLGDDPGLGQLAVGVAGRRGPAEARGRQVGLRQPDEEALQPRRLAEQDQQQAGGEGIEGARVSRLSPRVRGAPRRRRRARSSRPACRGAAPPRRCRSAPWLSRRAEL